MRYTIHTPDGTCVASADDVQTASDMACAVVASGYDWSYTIDHTPGRKWSVTRYKRCGGGMGFIGSQMTLDELDTHLPQLEG